MRGAVKSRQPKATGLLHTPDLFSRFVHDAFWRDPARLPPTLRIVWVDVLSLREVATRPETNVDMSTPTLAGVAMSIQIPALRAGGPIGSQLSPVYRCRQSSRRPASAAGTTQPGRATGARRGANTSVRCLPSTVTAILHHHPLVATTGATGAPVPSRPPVPPVSATTALTAVGGIAARPPRPLEGKDSWAIAVTTGATGTAAAARRRHRHSPKNPRCHRHTVMPLPP